MFEKRSKKCGDFVFMLIYFINIIIMVKELRKINKNRKIQIKLVNSQSGI
jgi:hypothetical protein